jgi:hypothetical protein
MHTAVAVMSVAVVIGTKVCCLHCGIVTVLGTSEIPTLQLSWAVVVEITAFGAID